MKELIGIIKDHILYRQQILKLARADLQKTYRGAALGWSWAIIKPAVTIFVYWFAFSTGFKGGGADVEGFPFFLWLMAGIIPWFYISDMLSQGSNAIRKYSYLVTKMKFPVSTIPTFVSISKFTVHIILVIIAVLIFILMGHAPDIYIIQLPLYMLLNFAFFTIFSLFASLLSAMSKDFANLIKSLIMAIFWLSGILWNVKTLEFEWIKKIQMINPVTYLAEGYRNCFIHKVWFFEQPERLICFAIVLGVLAIASLWTYKKLRKEIPDVL